MTLAKLLRPNGTSFGRGRVRAWSPSSRQGTPPALGRHAPAALRIAARVILWALLGTLVARGAITARSPRPRPLPPSAPQVPQRVEAFAVAFATEYLAAGGDTADRARLLLPYVPGQLASELNVAGTTHAAQRVAFATAAGATATESGYTVVVAARLVSRADRWVWLAVPVATGDGSLAVSDLPSIVAPPERLSLPPPDASGGDLSMAERARPILERFFALYLGGGEPAELAYLTSPGTRLELPERFADRVQLTNLVAYPVGSGVEVTARLLATDEAGLVWPLAYDMHLEDDNGRLEVVEVLPASNSALPGR